MKHIKIFEDFHFESSESNSETIKIYNDLLHNLEKESKSIISSFFTSLNEDTTFDQYSLKTSMYLETMEEILTKTSKIITEINMLQEFASKSEYDDLDDSVYDVGYEADVNELYGVFTKFSNNIEDKVEALRTMVENFDSLQNQISILKIKI